MGPCPGSLPPAALCSGNRVAPIHRLTAPLCLPPQLLSQLSTSLGLSGEHPAASCGVGASSIGAGPQATAGPAPGAGGIAALTGPHGDVMLVGLVQGACGTWAQGLQCLEELCWDPRGCCHRQHPGHMMRIHVCVSLCVCARVRACACECSPERSASRKGVSSQGMGLEWKV